MLKKRSKEGKTEEVKKERKKDGKGRKQNEK